MRKVKRNNFITRVKSHEKYVSEVINELESLGYDAGKDRAIEERPFSKKLMEALRNTDCSTSYYLRFQPDLSSVNPKQNGPFGKVALWEIKSAVTNSKNFSFELAPWEICRQVAKNMKVNIYFCFPNFYYRKVENFAPDVIYVPSRWPKKKLRETQDKYSDIPVVRIQWKKGSGTIFGLIYPSQYRKWGNLKRPTLF